MKKIYILSLLCMLTSVSFAQSNLKEILKNFNKPAKENVIVVSHRGDWRNAPENSIQAFQNCIDMGVDMVELDLKKTKDGVLVLMHDKKIDRTMNGKGFPENYTLDSLKMLRLKNGVGCKTRHQIPTFREVMELCKGKIMVNVDKGYDYFDDAMKVLKETGTVDQCIIKAELPYEVVKAEHGDVLDKMIFMPVVNLGKPGAEEVIDGYIKNMKPKAYELVFKTDDANTRRLIKKVRDSGARVFINTLWPELCGGHDDDESFNDDREALIRSLPEKGIGRIINVGASIETTKTTLELAAKYDYIYAAVGVHPSDISGLNEETFAWLKEQASLPKTVAIGEIGHHVTRLIRESYRLQEDMFNSGLDIVVIARNTAKDISYHEVESALLHLGGLHKILK
jgi:glycerophosphoryl diester phosphodiesterase